MPSETQTRYVVNAGKRVFYSEPGITFIRYKDKSWRRIVRAQKKRGRIDAKLAKTRELDLEVAGLADNSHERRRAVAADRRERKPVRT